MMRVIDVVYTDKLPMRPDDAEFGVTIDFVRGQSDPVQVFSAMAEMLSAFSEMDRVLIGAVSPNTEPVTVIEDVEAASITAWVRNKIEKIDDQALKEFDWKQQIGVYAVKAKYRILHYLDGRVEAETENRQRQLKEDLEALGLSVSSQLLPPPIDMGALIPPMNQVQGAKARLTKGEKITVKADDEPDYLLDTSSTAPVEQEKAADPPSDSSKGEMELRLLIRKPDFIGKAQWEFKHGRSSISASIEDAEWLARFHRGEQSTRIAPGARMHATVRYKHEYDGSGSVLHSEYDVIKVHGIIPPSPAQQKELFGSD